MAFSRRSFIGASAASLVAAGSLDFLSTPHLSAQSPLTPDEALRELVDGNERFAAGRMTSIEHDLKVLKERTVDKQEPYAAVLACADSRVPVELIFDQTIGHVFVTRVAGNLATTEIIASLEYGAAVLGTKVILVLGHANCGAVKAAIQGKDAPGQISALFPHIQPAIDQAGSDLATVTKANAQVQAKLLSEASTVIAPMVKEGKVKVVAGVYDIGTGKVTLA
ncbi:carbonic anhydrase [Alloacidobacterium dinghuense]|uniref:carbonic anhydrase n=1 Tax=Alloacidobacterium dinghuense TaxID=2763107 RepID=A0A7G8BPL8_9BACT|nr:carbonic anhydrase [Alloacidobacterium dinghuense]QNI34488.1 carbonic anhydrase [Alloacidobacterium dinghuense]